ncbi:MAG TPA: protein-L-isoaspartate(D-aspartate) O-methyltransferase [Candidatus Polarisedimenticolaceae bacterium]|nr:protein-L-isoaspartate(D-aspartate) O-methyltransferase [Candidatus Polarisedimenticolaceae bacterium]
MDAAGDMVRVQIAGRGIRDPAVLAAMRRVPRERFVPDSDRAFAYTDGPLSIGFGQTISQPYIVALMTELLCPHPGMRVLEIGTGSGYQTAVLAECAGEVFSVEIVPELSQRAARVLHELGHGNVHFRVGDGSLGWPEHAPYEGILAAAAPAAVPRALLDQLSVGGRLVLPVGAGEDQRLLRILRTRDGFQQDTVAPVRFVPMTGGARE